MRLRKYFALIFAAALCLALAACGKTTPADAGTTALRAAAGDTTKAPAKEPVSIPDNVTVEIAKVVTTGKLTHPEFLLILEGIKDFDKPLAESYESERQEAYMDH